MQRKNAYAILVLFMLVSAMAASVAAQTPVPSPAAPELGDVRGTIVTLYYYDFATGGKGAIVPLPDGQNPQEVQWDYTKAAPGTFVFYKVPFGVYYIEAVHGNDSFFAIANVSEGTTTANVAIPPNQSELRWQQEHATQTPTPAATSSPGTTAGPSASPSPSTSPGMTTISALAGLTLVALHVVYRKK